MKTQTIRVFDVLAFGPMLVWLAFLSRPLIKQERVILGLIGAGTVVYNAYNFIEVAKLRAVTGPTKSAGVRMLPAPGA